jgi:hypothetical protein
LALMANPEACARVSVSSRIGTDFRDPLKGTGRRPDLWLRSDVERWLEKRPLRQASDDGGFIRVKGKVLEQERIRIFRIDNADVPFADLVAEYGADVIKGMSIERNQWERARLNDD